MTLDEAKAALPLPVLWARLGLPGNPPQRDGQLFSCPFPARHRNGDKKPSFNFYSSLRRFKCHGCDIGGGSVDLLALALGLDKKAACRKLIELAGGGAVPALRSPSVSSVRVTSPPSGGESLETERRANLRGLGLWKGEPDDEWRQVQETRSISAAAVSLAVGFDLLRFGEVCGFPCWVLLDGSWRAAEARRLDRLAFPALGSLGERKAHSLKGTDKSWPLGVDVLARSRVVAARVKGKPPQRLELPPPNFRAVMMVEGAPDLLAALHFLDAFEVDDVWPVAMLGRSTGGKIHPEALELLAGKWVVIYPHADEDGGGLDAAVKWGKQLAAVACKVDVISFAGMRQRDGSPVKDFNDCCAIHPDDAAKLEGFIP